MPGPGKPAALLEADAETLWAQIDAASPLREPVSLADSQPWLDNDCSDERTRAQYDRRRSFIAWYAYAVPTREVIGAIARFLEGYAVIEVCAGAGLWAKLLSTMGVDIAATDGVPPQGEPYAPIQVLEAEEAVRAHPERGGMLMCWPPDRQDGAFRALQAFTGDRVVYVGDVRFTADEGFHALLARGWDMRDRLRLPSWPGLDDHAYLYVRNR